MLLVTALPLATTAALSGTNEISKVSYGSEYTLLDGSLDDYVKDCYEGSSWSLGNEKYGATYTIWNGEVYVTCTVLSMSNQTQAPNSISGATDYNGGTPVVLYGINITLDSDDL